MEKTNEVEVTAQDTQINRRQIFMKQLKAGTTDYTFKPPTEDVMQHTLVVKRVVLGKDVDPTELNLIEVETKTESGSVETFPFAYLRGSDMLQVCVDFVATETAKFTLAKGKGPVYIVGEYSEDWKEDDDAVDADESLDIVESENDVEEDGKENTEPKEIEVSKVGAAKVAAKVATDRKRKQDEEEDDVGLKKIRVTKGGEETEEAMDEVVEKSTA